MSFSFFSFSNSSLGEVDIDLGTFAKVHSGPQMKKICLGRRRSKSVFDSSSHCGLCAVSTCTCTAECSSLWERSFVSEGGGFWVKQIFVLRGYCELLQRSLDETSSDCIEVCLSGNSSVHV